MAMEWCTNGQGTPQNWLDWKLLKAYSNSNFIPLHPIPFHSFSSSNSNFDHSCLKCHSSQTSWPIFMQLVPITCICQALYDAYQKIENRSRKVELLSVEVLFVLSAPHIFPLPAPPAPLLPSRFIDRIPGSGFLVLSWNIIYITDFTYISHF